MPVGARDAQNLIVEVLIEVNPDRTVRSAEIVDQPDSTAEGTVVVLSEEDQK